MYFILEEKGIYYKINILILSQILYLIVPFDQGRLKISNLSFKHRGHRLEIFEYPSTTFKSDHESLGISFFDL